MIYWAKSLLSSDIDWFAVQELTKCLKPVYDTTTALQLKKLIAGEFFGECLKCKVQLQCMSMNNASYLALDILHAMERRETTLLPNAAFLAAMYVDPKVSGTSKIFSENSCTIPLWRRLQMPQESLNTTDVECFYSSSESENGSAPACKVMLSMRYSPLRMRTMPAHHLEMNKV